MPLYEYYCKACDTQFERLRPASAYEETAACPAGHASPRRVVSLFATVRAGVDVAETGEGSGCACGGGGCGCGH